MAQLDDTLKALLEPLAESLAAADLHRQRGGLARGIAWVEVSGRHRDGSWLEFRAHHRPIEQRLQAGLLAYQPLARGGRTVVVGEISCVYRFSPDEVVRVVELEVRGWLERLCVAERTDALGMSG